MRLFFLGGLLACGLACQSARAGAPAGAWTGYFDIDLWLAADPLRLGELDGNWPARLSPRHGRNVVLTRDRAAAGVTSDGWSIGYEVRHDASAITDAGTLEAIRMHRLGQHPDAPASVPVALKYYSWSARGLRVGRSLEWRRQGDRALRLDLSLAYYGQPRYRQDRGSGTVSYPASGAAAVEATRIDADSGATFPFMHGSASGSGVSMSAAIDAPLSDALTLAVRVDDLCSRMRWSRLPVIRQSIDVHPAGNGGYGAIDYRPLLTGQNAQLDLTTAIARHGVAKLTQRAGDWSYALQVERFAQVTIPTLAVARAFGWGTLTTRAETRFHTIGVGLERANLRLLLQGDSLRPAQARAMAAQLSYWRPF